MGKLTKGNEKRTYFCARCGEPTDWLDPEWRKLRPCVQCAIELAFEQHPKQMNLIFVTDLEFVFAKRGDASATRYVMDEVGKLVLHSTLQFGKRIYAKTIPERYLLIGGATSS